MVTEPITGGSGVGALTTLDHWEQAWSVPPRWRLPSGLNVHTRNVQRLLRRHVRPGVSFLEVGCAPGKMLAWVAGVLGAQVAGLDTSERGLGYARALFEKLGIDGDLRREDVFAHTFAPGSFDVVFSAGVIEHFHDPREIVRRHVELVKPGGRVIITVPNLAGLYGRLQRHLDPDSLALHNLDIMMPAALCALAPNHITACRRAYRTGRVSPWLLGLEHRWPTGFPRVLARLFSYGVNLMGVLQPIDVGPLCPMVALEIVRKP